MRNGHLLSSLQAPIPTSMLRKSASANCIETDTPSVAPARLTNVENKRPNTPRWTAAALNAQHLSSSEAFESGKIDPLPGAPTGVDEEESLEVSVRQMSYPQAPPGLELPHQTETVSSSCTNNRSTGSLLHETGACQPCAWFWKAGGCRHGQDCMRCQTCLPGEVKARKKAKNTLIRLGLVTPGARAE